MEENKQHIDQLFREALGNYTETPPPAVWAAVEQRLDADKRKPKGGLIWWGWLMLLLIAVGGGALIYNTQKKAAPRKIATNKTNQTKAPYSGTSENTLAGSPEKKDPSTVNSDQNAAQNNAAPQASTTGNLHNNPAASRLQPTMRHNRAGRGMAAHVPTSHRNNNAVSTVTAGTKNNTVAGTPEHSLKKKASATRNQSADNAVVDTEPGKDNNSAQSGVAKTTTRAKRLKRERTNNAVNPTVAARPSIRTNKVAAPSAESTAAPVSSGTEKKQAVNTAQQPAMASRLALAKKVTAAASPSRTKTAAKTHSPAKEKETRTAATPVIAAAAEQPVKKVKAPRSSNSSGKPIRVKSSPAGAAVAINPKAARAKPPRNTAPESAGNIAGRSTVRSSGKARMAKTAVATTARPAPKKARTSLPANKVASAANSTGHAIDNSLPLSLQGKNEEVRFPTAKPGDTEVATQPTTLAAPSAPDTTGNPVAESDNAGGDTPYTMNKQRKTSHDGTEAGLAVGYSFGFAKPAPGEVVISPYVQLGLSERLSLRFSPAYRFGNVGQQAGAGSDYYRINSNSITTKEDDSVIVGGVIDTFYSYFLSQNYDSIKLSSNFGGRTWAIDLPVTLNYSLGSSISIFGGPVFSYQGTISGTTSRQSFNTIRFDTILNSQVPIDTNTLIARFGHSGQPLSTAPADAAFSGTPAFRIGYLAGLRYNYGRWQGELSLQQNITGLNSITSEAVRKVYSQPYLRFTMGYSLWKPRQRNVQKEE